MIKTQQWFDRIDSGEGLKYSRFNDGEWTAISRKCTAGMNCDKHKYFERMGVDLENVLLNYEFDLDYILQFDRQWMRLPLVKETFELMTRLNSELAFIDKDFIRDAYENDTNAFKQFIKMLGRKNVVIVGPAYLEELRQFFEFGHVVVPLVDCYLEKDRILEDIDEMPHGNVIYLYSASMLSNILIDEQSFEDIHLDVGSVWDAFFVSPEYNFIRKRSTSNKPDIINAYKEFWI